MIIKNDIANIHIVVLLFILIVSGNYIGKLLPCRVQHKLEHNMILKHFIGILTLSFFVILSLTSYDKLSNIKKILLSFLLYIFFLAFAKTHYSVWFTLIILTSIIYILYLVKQDIEENRYLLFKNKNKEENINLLTKINKIISYLTLIIVFVGTIVYYLQKKKEYKKNFNFFKFFIGNTKCKHNKIYKIF